MAYYSHDVPDQLALKRFLELRSQLAFGEPAGRADVDFPNRNGARQTIKITLEYPLTDDELAKIVGWPSSGAPQ